MKRQRNLKCRLLSGESQSEKAAFCMIPTMCYSEKGKIMETLTKILEEKQTKMTYFYLANIILG